MNIEYIPINVAPRRRIKTIPVLIVTIKRCDAICTAYKLQIKIIKLFVFYDYFRRSIVPYNNRYIISELI